MDQIIFLIFGIIVTAAFFWLKNKNIKKNIIDDDKIKENLLNQLQSEFPESFNSLMGNETSYELIEKINQNRKKIIENELNQAKRELAAEKAAMDQININNKFLNDQIEKKEKTIKDLTKGLENKAELKELHDEAMQEVKNERTENNKILSGVAACITTRAAAPSLYLNSLKYNEF